MHALSCERVQIGGQRSNQGLSFAGAHFRNFPIVQRDAAEKLFVEMAHAQDAPACFPHCGEGLDEQIIRRFAAARTLPENVGSRA